MFLKFSKEHYFLYKRKENFRDNVRKILIQLRNRNGDLPESIEISRRFPQIKRRFSQML